MVSFGLWVLIMRGGIRLGAGRKPSEATLRVSVPVGILDEVNRLIAAYKSGTLNDCQIIEDDGLNNFQIIEDESLNDCREFKQTDVLIECHEIKSDDNLIDSQEIKAAPLKDNQEIKDAVKGLQGLNARTCKVLRKGFGSLYKAAESGVRAEYGGGLSVPNEFRHLMGDLE